MLLNTRSIPPCFSRKKISMNSVLTYQQANFLLNAVGANGDWAITNNDRATDAQTLVTYKFGHIQHVKDCAWFVINDHGRAWLEQHIGQYGPTPEKYAWLSYFDRNQILLDAQLDNHERARCEQLRLLGLASYQTSNGGVYRLTPLGLSVLQDGSILGQAVHDLRYFLQGRPSVRVVKRVDRDLIMVSVDTTWNSIPQVHMDNTMTTDGYRFDWSHIEVETNGREYEVTLYMIDRVAQRISYRSYNAHTIGQLAELITQHTIAD